VLHPGLGSSPDHALWKRAFTGSSGLFGILLQPMSESRKSAFFDDLHHFGMGCCGSMPVSRMPAILSPNARLHSIASTRPPEPCDVRPDAA